VTFPVYLRIGGAALHPHWVFETLGYGIGLYLCYRGQRRPGDVIPARTRQALVVAALAGGFAGSRLLALLEEPLRLAGRWSDPQVFLSGKTIVGGLVGGLVAVEAAKRLLRVQVPTGDLFTIPLIAGLAAGRIGCFLSGLDDQSYGVATRMPWGVDFGDGIFRHPTQLYEVVFLAALGAALVFLWDRLTSVGDRFKLFLLGYLAFRLLIDFIKPGVRVGGLSIIQWTCLAVLAFYAPHARRLIREVRSG
jgi:phosphatidylglycerol---prolipoprotein diacylglyceryl transferase